MNEEEMMCELRDILRHLNRDEYDTFCDQVGSVLPSTSTSDTSFADVAAAAVNGNKFDGLLSQLSAMHRKNTTGKGNKHSSTGIISIQSSHFLFH